MRLLGLAFVVLAGCITPSIPIPPPDPTDMNFHFTIVDNVSTATFNYPFNNSYCGGVAYLYDHAQHGGVIKDVNANCTTGPMTMPASPGDAVDFTVQTHVQTISTCVLIQEGAQSPANYCP